MSARQELMRERDAAITKRFGTDCRMAEFQSIHGKRKVLRDQNYLLEMVDIQKQEDDRTEANQLELIFIEGVNIGGWLGDITGDRDAYQTQAQATSIYDDFSHRLDTAVELTFAQPIWSQDEKESLRRMTIGFDVTVCGSPLVMLNKLTCHYGGQLRLPFGFSSLDYYAHGQTREAKPLVPRYGIGLNVCEGRQIWRDMQAGPTDGGILQAFRPNSPESLRMRFKVLSEIRAQNLLYYAMLPEDQTHKLVRQATLQIDAVDECLNAALRDCTQQLMARRVVPTGIFAPRRQSQKPRSDREALEDFFITETGQKYRNLDPFRQILGETRRLLAALYDTDKNDPVRKALVERRKIMPQNEMLSVAPFLT